MCYQLVERYSACHCLYYQHAVDRCLAYGLSCHDIKTRTILVGYTCQKHAQCEQAQSDFGFPNPKRDTSPDDGPNSSSVADEDSDDDSDEDSDGDSDDDLSSVKAFLFDDDGDESGLTSASSAESITALERLRYGFLYDKYLRDLWPQMFLKTLMVLEVEERIELFILRYSLDLQSLARRQGVSEDPINPGIRASQVVKRERRYIAHEIYKEYLLPWGRISQTAAGGGAFKKAVDDESDPDDYQQPDAGRFFRLHAFLFDSEPFRYFRKKRTVLRSGNFIGFLAHYLARLFENIFR